MFLKLDEDEYDWWRNLDSSFIHPSMASMEDEETREKIEDNYLHLTQEGKNSNEKDEEVHGNYEETHEKDQVPSREINGSGAKDEGAVSGTRKKIFELRELEEEICGTDNEGIEVGGVGLCQHLSPLINTIDRDGLQKEVGPNEENFQILEDGPSQCNAPCVFPKMSLRFFKF